MNKMQICKRSIMLTLGAFAILLSIIMFNTPTHAATSIASSTVKTQVSGATNTAISIKWNKCSEAQGYVIYKRQSYTVAYTKVKTVGSGTLTYTDSNLIAGKPFQYAVRAYRKENGKTVYSKYIAVTGATRPLSTTTTASAVSSTSVQLTWKAVSRLDGYLIYRKIPGQSWTLIKEVSKSTTSYTDTTAKAGTKYVYSVQAYKKGGGTKFVAYAKESNTVTTQSTAEANTISSIKSFIVKAKAKSSTNTAITIEWNKFSSAQGYCIYRRESYKVNYTKIATVSAQTTTYTNKNLIAGKPYEYAVRAYYKLNGKYYYSRYESANDSLFGVTIATRPLTTKTTAKAASATSVKLSWNAVSRLDGYMIYRKAKGGSWEFIKEVAKTVTFYTDTTAKANTTYTYSARAYKKGGGVKYLAEIYESSSVTTPSSSSNTTVSTAKFGSAQLAVMRNVLYAVETGGQVYGNKDYADFTEAYTNSSGEHAITIGAGQWYATEAQRLLKLIRTKMGETEWNKIDTGSHYVWKDVCNADWSSYRISKSSSRAKIIVKLISSTVGKQCQDELMDRQIVEYENEVRSLGVTDRQAVGMLINVRHQGGYGALSRIVKKMSKPYNLDSVKKALSTDTGGQVGTYRTRQNAVYNWLKTYMS